MSEYSGTMMEWTPAPIPPSEPMYTPGDMVVSGTGSQWVPAPIPPPEPMYTPGDMVVSGTNGTNSAGFWNAVANATEVIENTNSISTGLGTAIGAYVGGPVGGMVGNTVGPMVWDAIANTSEAINGGLNYITGTNAFPLFGNMGATYSNGTPVGVTSTSAPIGTPSIGITPPTGGVPLGFTHECVGPVAPNFSQECVGPVAPNFSNRASFCQECQRVCAVPQQSDCCYKYVVMQPMCSPCFR